MLNISIKPREFEALKDKRPFNQISADHGYWQSFHSATKSYRRRQPKRSRPDMRKDRRYISDIFKATTEQLRKEAGFRHAFK